MITLTQLCTALRTEHGRVFAVSDRATRLQAIIAIHRSARDPAFGGCRMRPFPSLLLA